MIEELPKLYGKDLDKMTDSEITMYDKLNEVINELNRIKEMIEPSSN